VLIVSNSDERVFLKYNHTPILRLNTLKKSPKRYYIAPLSVPFGLRKSHRLPELPRVNKFTQFVARLPFYGSF